MTSGFVGITVSRLLEVLNGLHIVVNDSASPVTHEDSPFGLILAS